MTFLVHRAARADLLVDGLADVLREPLADPFVQELVLVPAKGIERWLSQRLSHRLGHAPGRDDGVCAGVEFRSPWSLISEVLGTREHDPWAPDVLTWPLLSVLDECAGEPWAQVLSNHLGHGIDGEEGELRRGRRYAVARRLAGIFSSYADQRPSLLDDWAAGRDTNGYGEPLVDDLAWQPELWRRLLAAVDLPGPTERLREVVARLAQGPVEGLPPRLSLFGHTRLAATEATLLAALGTHHDVHLWLPHPSDVMWRGLVGAAAPGGRRRDDTSHALIQHPLLAAMSRDIRELQALLESVGAVDAGWVGPAGVAPDASLLATLQADIAAAREPARAHPGDTSVQVHACHGPARQVEVLRETVLGLLEDDPTLQPRDILVMCPDIESFAPLLTAAFGLGDAVAGAHPGHELRVQLADRSPQQTNPLLDVVAQVLELADGRVEATRVLDLLASGPVSRRFGLDEGDHETLARWVGDAGIRWAWDESGRERYGLDEVVQNTWRFGLDRILTGVVLSEDSRRYVDRALPLDDVSSTLIGLAGRLAEAADRLRALTTALSGDHPVEHWLATLRDGLGGIAEVAPGDEWQFAQVHRELARLGDAASATGSTTLRLTDVRAMLHRQLGGRPSRANFRTGTLTICTLTPMRSVPHRVVCLLGLDDQVFPRGGRVDGDDLLAREPMVGESDLRSQDRQLFLDAVMSAGERLVITYTGFNESTGQERPPSVPLREFIDAAYATAPSAEGLVVRHRSQAFHPDYLVGARPFSFDRQAPRAARATLAARTAPSQLVDLRLEAPDETEIDLEDLREALVNPVRAFLRQRLGLTPLREADEIETAIPVEVGGLAEWQVGQRMLDDALMGREVDDIRAREWRRGMLPPGQLGAAAMARVSATVGPLVSEFETTTQGRPARHVDIDVPLPDGRRIVGTVPGLHDDRLVRVGYSRLGAKQRIETFLDHAAVAASGRPSAVSRVIGRGTQPGQIAVVTNNPIDDPRDALAALVALRDEAMTRVVPLLAEPSWIEVTVHGYERAQEQRKFWSREGRSPLFRMVFGDAVGVEEINALVDDDGQSLLRSRSRALWQPIRRVAR